MKLNLVFIPVGTLPFFGREARLNKKKKKRETLRTRVTDDNVTRIRGIMTERPRTSLRQVSRETGLSLGSCHTAVRKIMKLYPYKITRIHELRGPDFQAHIDFCTFFWVNLRLRKSKICCLCQMNVGSN